MPHLEIKNVEKKELVSKIGKLSKELTEVIGCPEDWITISYLENNITFVEGSDKTFDNVFVEIKWFNRPNEIKHKVSEIIYNIFAKEGRDVMVNFVELIKEDYFENGNLC